MGSECATDVIVNVRRGPHSKLPRSWCAAVSGAVASSLVRHVGEYMHVWKWPVKASTQGNGLWLWLVERQNGGERTHEGCGGVMGVGHESGG